MYEIVRHNQFKKDVKKLASQNIDLREMKLVITLLANDEKLAQKHQDHKMNDDKKYKKCRDCHIAPDIVLIYKIDRKESILELFRIGSHSELFD